MYVLNCVSIIVIFRIVCTYKLSFQLNQSSEHVTYKYCPVGKLRCSSNVRSTYACTSHNSSCCQATTIISSCFYFRFKTVACTLEWVKHFTHVGVVRGGLLPRNSLLLSWHVVILHRYVRSLVASGCWDLHLFSYERRTLRFTSQLQGPPRRNQCKMVSSFHLSKSLS